MVEKNYTIQCDSSTRQVLKHCSPQILHFSKYLATWNFKIGSHPLARICYTSQSLATPQIVKRTQKEYRYLHFIA